MSKWRVCQNAERCLHFPTKGRPSYLIDREAVGSGFCKPCRDKFGRGDVDREPTSNPLIEVEMREVEEGANMKYQTLGGKKRHHDTPNEDKSWFEEDGFIEDNLALSDHPGNWKIEINPEEKYLLVDELPEDGVKALGGALLNYLPSTSGPDPISITDVEFSDVEKRRSNPFFDIAYQASNFPINGRKFRWANGSYWPMPNTFWEELIKTRKGWEQLPESRPDAPKLGDYNCASLVSDDEARAIFGGMSGDQVYYFVRCIAGFWSGATKEQMESKNGYAQDMVGSEVLPEDVRETSLHYAAAIGAAVRGIDNTVVAERAPGQVFWNNYLNYLETHVIPGKNFKTEKELVDWLSSNPAELDDFLWRPEALDFINESRQYFDLSRVKNILDTSSWDPARRFHLSEDDLVKLKGVQRMVLEFTSLIDRRWREKYQREGVDALRGRFCHPVGIPTDKLRPWHFIPGGYLVESGWMRLEGGDGQGARLEAKLPVDENGRPDPRSTSWDNVSPRGVVRALSTLEGLGDLAEACAAGNELWHTMYNRGLPRDSLYTGAALSMVDQNPNGMSQDDYSGTVRGLYHPLGKGIVLSTGPDALAYPTSRSRIAAIGAHLRCPGLCPRGAISLKEIDLANWRLTRLSDNMCGNEYGINTVKPGSAEPYNFVRLGREYHERVQDKIRSYGPKDGVWTYAQPEVDFVRPLVGVQRGEALRCFVETPGTYLRRTGRGGTEIEGAAWAVLNQVKFPLTPPTAYQDPAVGLTTDAVRAVNQMPGSVSLHPLSLLAKGSGTVVLGDDEENFYKGFQVEDYTKLLHVGPGRRGENFPRRLRFAALSMGEKAASSGVIDPGIEVRDGRTAQIREVANIHSHVAEPGLITIDRPNYAPELLKAPWHNTHVYARDYELGEMGAAYRALATNEDDRRLLLQGFLAGKQSVRQALTSPGRKSLNTVMAYFKPVEVSYVYGDLEVTGVRVDQKSHSVPGERKLGLRVDNSLIVNRFNGSFYAEVPGKDYVDPKENFSNKGDKLIASDGGFYGTRAGYTETGLEDTPIRFDEANPPIKAGAFLNRWDDTVTRKGLAGEYEKYDWEEVRARMGSRFAEMVGGMKKRLTANPHLVAAAAATAAFPHPTRRHTDKSLLPQSKTEMLQDELILRAAQDTEGQLRGEMREAAAPYHKLTLNDPKAFGSAMEFAKYFRDQAMRIVVLEIEKMRKRRLR